MTRLLLAPMEGLADDVLREVLTRVPGYDHAVTEFVRVSGSLLPRRAFARVSPELHAGSRTSSGTPVRVQLLGSDPACMGDNAAQLARMNPSGIDLNFGCPAPLVNRHGGGAALLDTPEVLHAIACEVRRAVPRHIPFTAKMRLGVGDTGRALECAQALADGGIEDLVVHARTKTDGYRPPAHWEWVARIADVVDVPVVANGEVWNEADWRRCREVSGAADVMLGRGAVSDPFLARRIRAGGEAEPDREAEWVELLPLIGEFWCRVLAKVEARHAPGRLKQWLGMLRRNFPRAEILYAELRPQKDPLVVGHILGCHGVPVLKAAA
ncbi:MAG: tRNA-dihydrouridine synthase [Zoogloea sp.]|jgi:tRNA-dihydrouridine synthase C|nr:tRNA-dihydrouridine synthase [Zoogloea sp.]